MLQILQLVSTGARYLRMRMPFGLHNAGCTFQSMMDMILGKLPYCFAYIDDILIASPESHLLHVSDVLDRLLLQGLSINPEKFVFTAPEVEYLGMRVSNSWCVPSTKRIKIISNFPRPVDKKGLQRFLCILNFYCRFIWEAAGLLFPLREALKGKSSVFTWNLEITRLLSSSLSKLQFYRFPCRRFSNIHVDLVGPLPQSQGFSYLFTIIDITSCWPEAVPILQTTAEECAKVLLRSWIHVFEVPAVLCLITVATVGYISG